MIYIAHGSAASWEWLAMITPCIEILRQLAKQMHEDLGSRQGTKHASPDLERDIAELMRSLKEHNVCVIEPGRTLNEDEIIPNAASVGLQNIDGPLEEFNEMFSNLQARCRMNPLVGEPYLPTAPGTRNTSDLVEAETELEAIGEAGAGAVATEEAIGTFDDSESSQSGSDSVSNGSSVASESSELDDVDGNMDVLFSLDSEDDVALDMDDYY